MRALAPEKGTRMKSLGLYRQMEDLYRLRALVDGIDREASIAESKKWRERAELEIESYLLARYGVADTTVH
jgi:hypothetical protein